MRILVGIGLTVFAFTLRAQEVDALTLKDLVTSAIESNYDIALVSYESELSELKGEDLSILLPQINFSSSYFNYVVDVPQYIFPADEGAVLSGGTTNGYYPVFLGLKHNMTADLSLRQRIFDVRFFGRDVGRTQLSDLANSQLDQKKEQIAADLANAYFQWKWTESNGSILAFNQERLQQLMAIIRRQITNQMATSFDSVRVSRELQGLAIQSQKLDASSQLLARRIRQLSKVGATQQAQLVTPLETPLLTPAETSGGAISPQSQTLSHAMSLNDLQQRANRLSGVPTLDFFGHLYWQSQSPTINVFGDGYWNNLSSLGVQLSVPIYNGEKTNRETQRLKLEASMLELRQQQLDEGEALLLQKAQNDLEFARSSLLLERQWQEQLQTELTLQERRFQEGLIGINELLASRAELMTSEQQVNTYLLNVRQAEIEILQIKGQLVDSILANEE